MAAAPSLPLRLIRLARLPGAYGRGEQMHAIERLKRRKLGKETDSFISIPETQTDRPKDTEGSKDKHSKGRERKGGRVREINQ